MYTDYKVLEIHNPEFIANEVKYAMSEGWQPLGGVSVRLEMGTQPDADDEVQAVMHTVYAQAMVK